MTDSPADKDMVIGQVMNALLEEIEGLKAEKAHLEAVISDLRSRRRPQGGW